MNKSTQIRILLISLISLWDVQSIISTPSSISPLFREIESKKSLYYYNKAPILKSPPIRATQLEKGKNSDSVQVETPASDRLYFPAYKYPYWGLPYGIRAAGPGYSPYDGVAGQFSGNYDQTALSSGGSGENGNTYYHPGYHRKYTGYKGSSAQYRSKKKAYKKKKFSSSPPKYNCKCSDSGTDDDEDDSYNCKCPSKDNERTRYIKKSEVKKKLAPTPCEYPDCRESKNKQPSALKRPCRYGYSSGSNGGCKSRPDPEYEEQEADPEPEEVDDDSYDAQTKTTRCSRYKTKGKCSQGKSNKPAPEPEDDNYDADSDLPQTVPQYIPYVIGYQPYQPSQNSNTDTTTGSVSQPQQQVPMQYQSIPPMTVQYSNQMQYPAPSTPNTEQQNMMSSYYSPSNSAGYADLQPVNQMSQIGTYQIVQPQQVQNAPAQQVGLQFAPQSVTSAEPNIAMIYAGTSESTPSQPETSQNPIIFHYMPQPSQVVTTTQPMVQYQNPSQSSDMNSASQNIYTFQTLPMQSVPQGSVIMQPTTNHNPTDQGRIIMHASNNPTQQIRYKQPFEVVYKPPRLTYQPEVQIAESSSPALQYYRPQQHSPSMITQQNEPIILKSLAPINHEEIKVNRFQIIPNKRPFDHYISTEMNLRNLNSEESPKSFISNHLNNYTASNFQSEKVSEAKENGETQNNIQQSTSSITTTQASTLRNEISLNHQQQGHNTSNEKVTKVISVSSSTSES